MQSVIKLAIASADIIGYESTIRLLHFTHQLPFLSNLLLGSRQFDGLHSILPRLRIVSASSQFASARYDDNRQRHMFPLASFFPSLTLCRCLNFFQLGTYSILMHSPLRCIRRGNTARRQNASNYSRAGGRERQGEWPASAPK